MDRVLLKSIGVKVSFNLKYKPRFHQQQAHKHIKAHPLKRAT